MAEKRKKRPGTTKAVKRSADPALVALGQRIAAIRGTVTQRDLALRAGLDVGTVSRLENGRFNPSFKKLQQIADSLGASLQSIVAEVEPATKPARESIPGYDPDALDPLGDYDEAFYRENARAKASKITEPVDGQSPASVSFRLQSLEEASEATENLAQLVQTLIAVLAEREIGQPGQRSLSQELEARLGKPLLDLT